MGVCPSSCLHSALRRKRLCSFSQLYSISRYGSAFLTYITKSLSSEHVYAAEEPAVACVLHKWFGGSGDELEVKPMIAESCMPPEINRRRNHTTSSIHLLNAHLKPQHGPRHHTSRGYMTGTRIVDAVEPSTHL